jgi:predicted transcriptional regulator
MRKRYGSTNASPASEVPALVKLQAEHPVKTRCHIELKSWHIAEIQQAVTEADGGGFATDDEFNAVVKKYAG